MNARENLLALLRREPYEWVPVQFDLCPALEKTYHAVTGSTIPYADYFAMPWRNIGDIRVHTNPEQYLPYHAHLKPGASIDLWGVAHEPGSDAAMHMTYMRSPLRGITDPDTVRAYPLPDFAGGDASHQAAEVESIHARGLAAMGNMQCTVWETAWYMRGMEDLMMDMLSDDPIASYLLDAVTDRAAIRAASYARAGADLLFLGDDIGMQRTPMMSTDLYCTWLKPRLKRVIDAARAVKPDIIVCFPGYPQMRKLPSIPGTFFCAVTLTAVSIILFEVKVYLLPLLETVIPLALNLISDSVLFVSVSVRL